MAKKEFSDWVVCGRVIGRASGWDQVDTFCMQLYDLQKGPGYKGPIGDVTFDFESGRVQTYTDNGDVLITMDIIEAIQDCPSSKGIDR